MNQSAGYEAGRPANPRAQCSDISSTEVATRIRDSKAHAVDVGVVIGEAYYAVVVSWNVNILHSTTACWPFYWYWQIYLDPCSKFVLPELNIRRLTRDEHSTVPQKI